MNTKNILKGKEIKKTLARTAILNILKKIKKPISVSEIIEKLNQTSIKIDRVTVFRNINLMTKKGLINKVEFNEGKFRYELTSLPHHHHIVCTKCGNVKDIKSDLLHDQIDKISKTANKLYGFETEEHKVEFFGKCKTCKNIKSNPL
ncbi:MAG: Fur family transcriptional regulator [Candidatus Levyibacteriota bacterium]